METEENGRFYFIANNLALDFTNTLIVDESDSPLELVNSFSDLVNWASAAGILGPDQASVLKRGSSRGHSTEMLRRALSFRSELKKMAKAVVEGERVPASSIDAINEVLSRTKGHFELTSISSGYALKFQTEVRNGSDFLLPIAESAARLLSETDLSLVRKCRREACVLYFYDASKRHGRQWCSMSVCGNRAKAAAHYRRSHLQ